MDELDEVAVAVLIEIFCSEIRELILFLRIVDADISFLHELLLEEVPEGNVLYVGIGIEGERSQVMQRIFLEKNC